MSLVCLKYRFLMLSVNAISSRVTRGNDSGTPPEALVQTITNALMDSFLCMWIT